MPGLLRVARFLLEIESVSNNGYCVPAGVVAEESTLG